MPVTEGVRPAIRLTPAEPFPINPWHVVAQQPERYGGEAIACSCGTLLNRRMLNPGDWQEFMWAVRRHATRDQLAWAE